MGLIAARPEDPEEWAGIPSEPRDIDSGIDGSTAGQLAPADAFGLLGGGAIESITIPIAAHIQITAEDDSEPGEGRQRA